MRLDKLETPFPAYLPAADVVMVFRTVQRKEYSKILALEVIDDIAVEKGPVRIDGESEPEYVRRSTVRAHPALKFFTELFTYDRFREFDTPVNRIHAEQRFPAEKRDVEKPLAEFERPVEGKSDGRLHDVVRHHQGTGFVADLVIAVGAAQVAAFRER